MQMQQAIRMAAQFAGSQAALGAIDNSKKRKRIQDIRYKI